RPRPERPARAPRPARRQARRWRRRRSRRGARPGRRRPRRGARRAGPPAQSGPGARPPGAGLRRGRAGRAGPAPRRPARARTRRVGPRAAPAAAAPPLEPALGLLIRGQRHGPDESGPRGRDGLRLRSSLDGPRALPAEPPPLRRAEACEDDHPLRLAARARPLQVAAVVGAERERELELDEREQRGGPGYRPGPRVAPGSANFDGCGRTTGLLIWPTCCTTASHWPGLRIEAVCWPSFELGPNSGWKPTWMWL